MRGDRWLLVFALALTAVGVVMVYSSSAILGISRYEDPDYFFFQHLWRTALGVAVLIGCALLPLRWVERRAHWALWGAVGLLGLVAVFGHASHGAARWLKVGVLSLQPTELARVAAVVFLARCLRREPPAARGFVHGMLPPLGILGVLCGLIVLQPNLSSAALLGLTGLTMLYLAGARLRHLAVPLAAGAVGAVAVVVTHPYMMKRVHAFVDFLLRGDLDPQGTGWSLSQSLIAIGSGGWLGRGLGMGLRKYLFLSEAHTDFIFSMFAEELGFLGVSALVGLIALFLWRGLRAAARATDPFAALLAGGLTLQIGFYALANLAVATGVAPTTGVPLPFVSYGGTALLANLAAAGLIYGVSALNEQEEALTRQRWSREVS
jgi:cell division protein FtsW